MQKILDNFSKNIADVEQLIAFDTDVLGFVIKSIEDLNKGLIKSMDITNEEMNGARLIQILKTIRENSSFKPRYSLILNQAIVLLVSYFASAIEDIFSLAVGQALRTNAMARLMKEEVKITIAELMEAASNTEEAVVALLIEKKDLSFQDMQAIHRAFREYLGVEMEKDATVNEIILAQGCRHVIVHAGAEVTHRLIRQISNATPRTIKNQPAIGSVLQFSHAEIETVATCMKQYLTNLAQKSEAALLSQG
jgi:hypothetical protein